MQFIGSNCGVHFREATHVEITHYVRFADEGIYLISLKPLEKQAMIFVYDLLAQYIIEILMVKFTF